MAAIKQFLLSLKPRVIAALQEAWATEPAAITLGAVAAIEAAGAAFHVVIGTGTAQTVAGVVLPIIFGALLTRSKVRPAVNSVSLDVVGSGPRHRVVSHHRLRRRARAERNRIKRLQREAVTFGGDTAYAQLEALGVKAADTLTIPDRRIGGWWVVEVVG
jgi:hypothetical protein